MDRRPRRPQGKHRAVVTLLDEPKASGASPPVMTDPLGAFAMASGPASKGPRAIVLEKPGEIYEMVKKILQVNGNQMKQCYEQRLKLGRGSRAHGRQFRHPGVRSDRQGLHRGRVSGRTSNRA